MQIEVRHSGQGVVFQQDLSAKEIELTDTELATIYGGADQPVVQQQIQQQVGPATPLSQQQQTTADPISPLLASGASGITTIIGSYR